MLHLVGVKRKSFLDYLELIPPQLAEEIHALAGRFLIPRLLRDELRLFADVLDRVPAPSPGPRETTA